VKVVMTLLARDEADVVDAQLAYHLNAGVDFVIATDNRSQDGTTEILEAYEREGCLHLIREPGDDMQQGPWVTRMAQLAAGEYGADWVINADADEFYWPRGSSIKEALAATPERYGYVRSFVRAFLLRGDDDGTFFAERMNVRLTPQAPINDPGTLFRPGAKIVHRGDAAIVLGHGTHTLAGTPLSPLRGWYPLELLHFPLRTREQAERKFVSAWSAWSRNPDRDPSHYLTRGYEAAQEGRLEQFLDSLTVTDDDLERGLADGSLVVDNRLRDALRLVRASDGDGPRRFLLPGEGAQLQIARPNLVDEAQYAVDAAVLGEADVARLQRRLDELEQRLASLERRFLVRARTKIVRLARSRSRERPR
jgi:hypothetical protein